MAELAWEKIAFIKALDSLVDYHEIVRTKLMTTTTSVVIAASAKKPDKFVSFLDHVGHDFKVGFDSPVVQAMAKTAITIFAPTALPLFNQTMASVITAEQNAAAIGAQSSGPQKLASVVSIMGGLIKQALSDVGKPNDDTSVQKYVSAVVTILDATPVSADGTVQANVPVTVSTASPVATGGASAASAIFP